MRVISIVSGKGGVGKTTVASNLGAILASKHNQRVLVIDANVSNSNLGLYYGIDQPPVTLNHVLKGEADLHEAIYTHHSGAKVIPSSLAFQDLKGLDIFKLRELMESHQKRLAKNNDIVIFDCAPGLGREPMCAIKSSDEVIFVSIPYIAGLMDIVRFDQIIRDVDVKPLGVVLNMVSNYKHELSGKEIESFGGFPLLSTISLDTNVLKSHALRIPVSVFKPRSVASKQFYKLAEAILRRELRNE